MFASVHVCFLLLFSVFFSLMQLCSRFARKMICVVFDEVAAKLVKAASRCAVENWVLVSF